MLVSKAVFYLPHISVCLKGIKNKLPEIHLTVQLSRNRTAISERILSSAIKKLLIYLITLSIARWSWRLRQMAESVWNMGVQTLAGKKPHLSHCQVSTIDHIRSDQRWNISFRTECDKWSKELWYWSAFKIFGGETYLRSVLCTYCDWYLTVHYS